MNVEIAGKTVAITPAEVDTDHALEWWAGNSCDGKLLDGRAFRACSDKIRWNKWMTGNI